MNTKSQTEYLNVARVVACFAVVLLHILCTPVVFCQSAYSDTELFFIRLFRNSLNWCVPVFVMISGVLFLNPEKEIPLKNLFGKYIRRLVLVIITFGTVYSLIEICFIEKAFSLNQIPKAIVAMCFGKSWDHLWYLYMAVGIYMLSPALKIFIINASDKILFYTLSVLFIFSSIIPYANIFLDFINNLPNISIYIFYMILGYSVHYKKFELKILPSVFILFVYMIYLAVIQKNNFFLVENKASLRSVGYNSPVVVLAAFSIFSLCKKATKIPKIINWISSLTFGIYIIHPVPINFCYKVLHLTVENYFLISSLCIVTIICFTTSIFATFVLRKIPFVRKYFL